MMRSRWMAIALLLSVLWPGMAASQDLGVPAESGPASSRWLESEHAPYPGFLVVEGAAEVPGVMTRRPLMLPGGSRFGGSKEQDPPYIGKVLRRYELPAPTQAYQNNASGRERSVGRAVLGAVAGGAGGFFAGGYLGALIDGDCNGCDDPGLKGALIGAPVGAALGAIFGGLYLF